METSKHIVEFLKEKNVKFVYFEHEVSGPSNLSREIRSKHGYPDAVGAKALILVVTFSGHIKKNVLVVIPGHKQLDKKKLKLVLKNIKEFRFASKEELFELTGLVPGQVPPFGKPILNVDMFILDKSFNSVNQIGFNVARLDASIVMDFQEFRRIITPDFYDFLTD
jgi:prolyl-tRNA editing enzyme YbaK/EbsC (Cys-tRNA(Pro) deacylase)